MTALVEPVQKWLGTGLGFFYPEICQLCETERATARTGSFARAAGGRCASSNRRFADAADCRSR